MAHTHLDRVWVTTGLHISFRVIMWQTHPTRTLITPRSQNNLCSWTSQLSPAYGTRWESHADCDVLQQLQDSAPKDDFLENSLGSQDNISQPLETPELEPISPDTLSLSPTSPLLSFSQKMEELSLQALFVASPQISTKKRRAAQPPKTADPALPPPPVRAIRHARAQTFLHQLQMNQKQLITALSDMCRVPAILAATFTNIYRTSGNPVCL